MKATSHLAFAGLLGVGAAGFGAEITPGSAAALALGALLPDIDTGRSRIGRIAGPLSALLERRFGHRTLTHSLLGLALLALLASPLLLGQRGLWTMLLAGCASHLLLDTATVSGVPLLWPSRLRFWLVGNRAWRVPTGSARERAWLAVLSLITLALAPLAVDGFTPWFHRALGTSYGAVEDYLRWKDGHEVWATVRGSNLLTGETIRGRYRVIDALHSELILIEDAQGHAHSVGLGQQATISAVRVRVWAGAALHTRSERIDPSGGTIGELLSRLPANAERIHITGILHSPDHAEPPAAVGRYQRVRRSGGALELRSASPQELAGLAHLWIERGSALVHLSFAADSEPAPLAARQRSAPGERMVIALAGVPDLGAVIVENGQAIEAGDPIARYPEGDEIDRLRTALRTARQELAEIDRDGEADREAGEIARERLQTEADRAREAFGRSAWLVARDALPANRLRAAGAAVDSADGALEAHDRAEAADLRERQASRQRAAAELSRLERRLATALASLEIRSPVSGIVAGVRTLAADRNGLDIEIVLLREKPR